MKKLISLIIVCFFYSSLHAQALRVRVDSLSVSIGRSDAKIENLNIDMEDIEESVDGLAKQVENLSYLVETQKEIISQEQSAIENSMGAVNIVLAVFALILTIGGIYLGWFINRKEKKVQALLMQVETKKEEVEKLEEKTSKIKDDIVELNNNINGDIEGLYERLKKEETVSLFRRLVEVPWDISNVGTLLLARKIDISNFKYLVLAYRNLKDSGTDGQIGGIMYSYKDLYLVQFFQHFCGPAISHSLIKDDLIEFFPAGFSCAYQSDIEYSTNSLIMSLNRDKSIGNKPEILYTYIKALNESKHNTTSIPYEIIVSKYDNDDDLIQIWEQLISNSIIIKQFGELLCDRFSTNNAFVSSVKDSITKMETEDKHEPDSK